MKFKTPAGSILELKITPFDYVSGDYSNTYDELNEYLESKLKSKGDPYIPYAYLKTLILEATEHAKKEKAFADRLRLDAPNSTTYSFYRFYHQGRPDPDLDFLNKIQRQLKLFDAEKINEQKQEPEVTADTDTVILASTKALAGGPEVIQNTEDSNSFSFYLGSSGTLHEESLTESNYHSSNSFSIWNNNTDSSTKNTQKDKQSTEFSMI